jgi:beta-glucosidase
MADAGNPETQGGRHAIEANLTPGRLRCWFLPPFQWAVEADVCAIMIGYQTY